MNSNGTSTKLDAFKTSYKSSFIKTCVGDDIEERARCTCIANYLVSHYNNSELSKISRDYEATGEIPEALTNASYTCDSNLNDGSKEL